MDDDIDDGSMSQEELEEKWVEERGRAPYVAAAVK
jgi:hypothetical protein